MEVGVLAEELPHGKRYHVTAVQQQVGICEILIKNLREPVIRLTEVSVRDYCNFHGIKSYGVASGLVVSCGLGLLGSILESLICFAR